MLPIVTTSKLPNYIIASSLMVLMASYCLPSGETLGKATDRLGAIMFNAVDGEPEKVETGIRFGTATDEIKTSKAIYVPLKPDKRALMLDAEINKDSNLTMVLDTGATYTAISKEAAEDLGYDLESAPKIWVTTANGRVALPKIRLKTIDLNGYVAKDVDATVMTLPSKVPFSGLLGLSFIRNHKITIDTESDKLLIEPRS